MVQGFGGFRGLEFRFQGLRLDSKSMQNNKESNGQWNANWACTVLLAPRTDM